MNNSYKGKILISTPDSSGYIFSRSVVLIVDHNEDGAFGLILNKKNKEISNNLGGVFGFPVDVYEGGTVENEKVFFIVKGVPTNDFFVDINEDYYVSEGIQAVITEVFENRLSIDCIKIFSGYSGWVAQQLETEIKNKFWTVVDVQNLDYTQSSDEKLWKNIMQSLGGEFLLWANAPSDVSLN